MPWGCDLANKAEAKDILVIEDKAWEFPKRWIKPGQSKSFIFLNFSFSKILSESTDCFKHRKAVKISQLNVYILSQFKHKGIDNRKTSTITHFATIFILMDRSE